MTEKTTDTILVEESKIPKWISAALFEGMLKKNIPNFMKLSKFQSHSAMAPGENYATTVLRIELEFEDNNNVGYTKKLSYILKVPHDHKVMKEIMGEYNMFKVEEGVYREVLPDLEKLYYDVSGAVVKIAPQQYYLDVDMDYILLEDLLPLGFLNANRLEGLDMMHMQCVLKKLAILHAASATRVATNGSYADIYARGIFTNVHRKIIKEMYDGIYTQLMEAIRTFNGHEIYIGSVENLHRMLVDELFKVGIIDPNEFNVLNHSDCWTNNIMFQYDGIGKITETFFLDFQATKYGSPAIDLLYLIISSANYEIKLKEFDYFIRYYHHNLLDNLIALKYPNKLPSLKDIHMALHKYGIFGYTSVICVLGAALIDPLEVSKFKSLDTASADGSEFKKIMFTNDRYRRHAEIILPWLYNRGALECSHTKEEY